MYFLKILFFLVLNNVFSKNQKYSNCKKESNNINSNDKENNKFEDEKRENDKENEQFNNFNKDFKYVFLKNAFFQHNNNCTLNAVFSSLFNFPQIQNFLTYNDFNDELLNLSKKLLQKAINDNNKNEAINYLDIYNNIFEYLKKNKPEIIGGGNLSDTINTNKFIKLFDNLGILIFYQNQLKSFIDYELTKQYLINKDNLVKIINNRTNNNNFKNILKNNDIVKKLYKELKYYNKICEIIDNLNFNRNNVGSFENGENMIDLEYDKNNTILYTTNNDENTNLFLDLKNVIIIPENESVKEYIKNLKIKLSKTKEENLDNNFSFNFFYDKILEDNKIELELISINFIEPSYHIFTINKNENDNKWYIFDDLYKENGIVADFEQLLKDGFYIKKSEYKYRPEFFYFNAKLKK